MHTSLCASRLGRKFVQRLLADAVYLSQSPALAPGLLGDASRACSLFTPTEAMRLEWVSGSAVI